MDYLVKSIAKIICQNTSNRGKCDSCGFYKEKDCFSMDAARRLYEVGYVPVLHGRWDSVENPQWKAYSHDKCSVCGWWNTRNARCYDGNKRKGHSLNYCPNCGAKMQKK